MKMNWIIYALIGMVSFSVMVLIFKKLTLSGMKPNVLLFFIFGFGMLFYLGDKLYNNTPFNLNSKFVLLLVMAAFLSYLGNLLYVKSIEIAPNAGYSAAVIGLHLILVSIGSYFIFGSEIFLKGLIGLVLGIIAIILLSL